jgi:hypothetical protein
VSSECRQHTAPGDRKSGEPDHDRTRTSPPTMQLVPTKLSKNHCGWASPNLLRLTASRVIGRSLCLSLLYLSGLMFPRQYPARSFSPLRVRFSHRHYPLAFPLGSHSGKLWYRARPEPDNPGREENVTPWRKSLELRHFLLAIFLASPPGVPRCARPCRRLSPSPRRGLAAR